jgi:uncharacterized cupredoxin-like copper-binding protein
MPTSAVSRRLALGGLLLAVALLVAVSFALSSRGGPATVRVAGHVVAVTLNEYSIKPQNISVPAGSFTLVVHNSGILTHNLTLEHEHLDSKGEPVIIASSRTLLPGATVRTPVEALNAGRYRMTSTIANQADLGMTGTLSVR